MISNSFDFMMFAIFLLVITIIIFLVVIEPRISRAKLTNKNEHGSSKFADLKEIEKHFEKESILNLEKAGFPVYYDKNFTNCYFDNSSPHWIVIGSTGSGKSVTLVIPECIMFARAKEKHSVLVTDPKGEIFRATGKIFEENGYEVKTIDFRNPQKSTKINIMQPVIDEFKNHCSYDKKLHLLLARFLMINDIDLKDIMASKEKMNEFRDGYNIDDYIIDIIESNHKQLSNKEKDKSNLISDITIDKLTNEELLILIREYQNKSSSYQAETNRLVISLADLIFTEKEVKDPFWINASKQLFIGIVGIFLEDYKEGLIKENKINISSVKKFQNSSLIKENQTFLQRNLASNRAYGSLSKDYLTSILSASENTYKSITAVFSEKMNIFDDLNVENVTSENEFDLSSLGKKPVAFFIIVPDEDRTYFQLVTIIVGVMTKSLTKLANLPENKGRLPVAIEFILDEFANCPPLNDIQTLVSVARSRRMRFQFFIQSFAQLDQVYGKDIASIILDNAAMCYLKTNSVDTAKVIVSKMGKSTILTSSMSQNTDPFKIGANQTTSLMGRELLTETEIINLKYKTIIFPTNSNPIFRDTYMYTDIFGKYREEEIERKPSVIKRMISNYYTVEELRKTYDKDQDLDFLENLSARTLNKKVLKENKKLEKKDDVLLWTISHLKKMYVKNKIVSESLAEGVYKIEIDKLLTKLEKNKIKELVNINFRLEIIENSVEKTTAVVISNVD